MPVEVRVPTLGESVVEATVGRWLKAEGDSVAYGDPLVELETDKVNVEITAEQDGQSKWQSSIFNLRRPTEVALSLMQTVGRPINHCSLSMRVEM